jgi:hypothetical protein
MRRFVLTSLALAAVGVLVPTTGRGEARPSPQLAPANAPKSEFAFRPGFSKDPFYPRSQDVPPPTVHNPSTQQSTSVVPDWIILKGISRNRDRKLAIINNYTLSEGEEFNLKRSTKLVTVRLVTIKEQSVVISVDGATKELNLRVN